jgi:hypothetical protein
MYSCRAKECVKGRRRTPILEFQAWGYLEFRISKKRKAVEKQEN